MRIKVITSIIIICLSNTVFAQKYAYLAITAKAGGPFRWVDINKNNYFDGSMFSYSNPTFGLEFEFSYNHYKLFNKKAKTNFGFGLTYSPQFFTIIYPKTNTGSEFYGSSQIALLGLSGYINQYIWGSNRNSRTQLGLKIEPVFFTTPDNTQISGSITFDSTYANQPQISEKLFSAFSFGISTGPFLEFHIIKNQLALCTEFSIGISTAMLKGKINYKGSVIDYSTSPMSGNIFLSLKYKFNHQSEHEEYEF
ncbi:MAG: hypothetical protein EAZ53_13240 [Bacteroidetes bacterium]|nr:MAG: hypothetical protein EAZ53_13240 [Bacteroidota bacterium]